jgi:hypothetical protein
LKTRALHSLTTSTGDKGPAKSCEAKGRVRRATEPVIENRYFLDSPQFTILKTNSPYKNDDEWQMNMDGKGFALQLSVSHDLLSPNVLEGKKIVF